MRIPFDVGGAFYPGSSDEDDAYCLQALMEALVRVDQVYLRRYPQTPKLVRSGIVYGRTEVWDSVPDLLTRRYGDCFPIGTLLLKDNFSLIPIEAIEVGDRIWGRDAWTTVKAKADKGDLAVDCVVLNNGARVMLTGGHHLFALRCPKHIQEINRGYGCACPIEERETVRVRVREIQSLEIVTSPKRLPFGTGHLDSGRAYVEGLYVSDGWSEPSRFAISGLDGAPKEDQKREVERICKRLGIDTRWHEKYIAVNNRDWAQRMKLMGGHAPEKHVLSLNLDESTALETLRGVMADGTRRKSGGWAFTTTSRLLAIQVKVLHKMLGRSCSSIATVQPGVYASSFTKLPVWGVGIRDPQEKGDKLLRVKRVERDLTESACWDIETSDGYVYLPEHDVTVSNCKSLTAMHVAEERQAGKTAQPVFRLAINPETGRKEFHILSEVEGKYIDMSRLLGMEQYHQQRGLWMFPNG